MTENSETRRTRRLERARAFLEAGRARTDPGPVPPPALPSEPAPGDGAPAARPDPTRFGDWEKNGRCIDF